VRETLDGFRPSIDEMAPVKTENLAKTRCRLDAEEVAPEIQTTAILLRRCVIGLPTSSNIFLRHQRHVP
jgi:hypothetical protein